MRLLFFLLVVLLGAAAPAAAAEYFASPAGTGTLCTTGAPCTAQTGLGKMVAGDTLTLLPGIYKGASGMIRPSATKSCTSNSPCVVRAQVEGMATVIDGEFAREPLYFSNNDHWRIEGVNARNGSWNVIRTGEGSIVTFRRIIAWDALATLNGSVWHNIASDSICEDCAFFGVGSSTVMHINNSGSLRLVRTWMRFEGSVSQGSPKAVLDVSYESTPNMVCENCIITGNTMSMPDSFTVTTAAGVASTGADCFNTTPWFGTQTQIGCLHSLYRIRSKVGNPTFNDRCHGCLVYLKADDNWPALAGQGAVMAFANGADGSGVHLREMMAYIHPSNPRFNSLKGFILQDQNAVGTDLIADGITSLRGSSGDTFEAVWSVTNRVSSSTLAGIPNPYTGTTGAQFCKQWTPGGTTAGSDPLWPWPMNDRIKEATGAAGRYAGGLNTVGSVTTCLNCVGGRAARTAVDVTAEVEALFSASFGSIPVDCKTPGTPPPVGPPPTQPPTTSFPTTALLDDFQRADGAVGANWVTLNGSGLKIVSGEAMAFDATNFHISKWATSFDADQEAFVTVKALPQSASHMALALRLQNLSNRYSIGFSRVSGANDQVLLYSVVSGVFTPICGTPVTLSFDFAVGDKIGVRALGANIEAWVQRVGQSWTRVAACSDTSIAAGGAIALGHGDFATFDDFSGGNYGAGVPAPEVPAGTLFPVTVERPAAAERPAVAQ